MEAQSRRENLKFYNIQESGKESWAASENKMREYLTYDLHIDESKISIERAHRIGSQNKPRPVIVKFSFYKDKDRVLQAYREKRKIDRMNGGNSDSSSKIGVCEDFPQRVSRTRQYLIPFMQKAIKNGKRAYLQYDRLIIDGKRYVYDSEIKCPVELSK